MKRSLVFFGIVFSILSIWPVCSDAAGPWKAQVVDAGTGKPLEGVVVLAVWTKCAFITMDGCGDYYDSEETVTGSDGRFVIQTRWSLLRTIQGPEFKIFKPGYGQWRFQGYMSWPKDVIEQKVRIQKAWEQFQGEGVVIELPPLKTWKEQREFLSYASPPGEIPDSAMPKYLEAIDQERVRLGFTPSGRSKVRR